MKLKRVMKQIACIAMVIFALVSSGSITNAKTTVKNKEVSGNTVKVEYLKAETTRDNALEKAIAKEINFFTTDDMKSTRYYYNKIDLNDDGSKEIIVELVGPYTSGSGGDTGLIFNQNYKLIQRLNLVTNPIIISTDKTNGWHDIIYTMTGGGIASKKIRLKFDGKKYPNANDGETVVSNADLSGIGIINNDIAKEFEEKKGLYLGTTSYLPDFKLLEMDKTYQYDLDGDGKNEKVAFKQNDAEKSDNYLLSVSINNKEVYNQNLKCFGYFVSIGDLDVADGYKDILIYACGPGDLAAKCNFLQYKNAKLEVIKEIKAEEASTNISLNKFTMGKVKDNNTFAIIADTPAHIPALGCYFCSVPYQIKDGKISAVKTNSYNLSSGSQKFKYQAKKKIVSYKTVKLGAVVTFTLKIGNKVSVDRIYFDNNGKCYVRLVNGKGVKGWIDGTQTDLFIETPSWGG